MLNDILETLVQERIREIEKKRVFKPILSEIETRTEKYRQEIIAEISESAAELLEEYSDALNEKRVKESELYYIQGFKDALQLIRGN